MLFRIYTEDVNREETEALAGAHFDGFTTLTATGFWQGVRERSLVIEIVDEPDALPRVRDLAAAIKRANHQQAVLVQSIENASELI